MTLPTKNPQGLFTHVPLQPHQLLERRTRIVDAFVLCHLGVPQIESGSWSLQIDGLVRRPRSFSLRDLKRFPRIDVMSIHECAGSPLKPSVPTRRINNVQWGGVRLAEVLDTLEPEVSAKFLWSYGADYGEFDGIECDAYLKDLPIERVREDVLIAFEMNQQPLRAAQGFPARLVVPGFYGTNSVKWLTRITVADRRAQGPFTERWYNDPILNDSGNPVGRMRPVWSIAPESVIVSPAPQEELQPGGDVEIWGWAWADEEIAEVTISAGDGADWLPAGLEPRSGRSWQRFSLVWRPTKTGKHDLSSKARIADGTCQPASGWRNAIHSVSVRVL